MKKKAVALLIIGIILSLVIVCILVFGRSYIYSWFSNEEESKNILDVYTVEEIYSADRYHLRSVPAYRGDSTNVTGIKQAYDYDYVLYDNTFLFPKILDGIKTLQVTLTEKETVYFSIDCELFKGNAAIFVFVDGQIYRQIDPAADTRIKIEDASNKEIVIKLVGIKAKFDLELERSFSPNA